MDGVGSDCSSVKLGKHAWAMIPNGAAYKATHTEKTRLFFAF